MTNQEAHFPFECCNKEDAAGKALPDQFVNEQEAIVLPYFAAPSILNPAFRKTEGYPVKELCGFRGYASSKSAPGFSGRCRPQSGCGQVFNRCSTGAGRCWKALRMSDSGAFRQVASLFFTPIINSHKQIPISPMLAGRLTTDEIPVCE